MARLLGALALVVTGLAHAQSSVVTNVDYNFDRTNRALSQQLNNVEQFHLGPGIEHARARDWVRAYADLNFILEYFPNHPRALAAMSEVCRVWKSPKCDFASYAEKAVAVNPKITNTYIIIGNHAMRENRLDDAINSFKRVIALNPDSLNAHYNLGLAYLNKKAYEQANEHAQRAYELGAPLPGLQRKLTEAGHWKPLEKPKAANAEGKSQESAAIGKATN